MPTFRLIFELLPVIFAIIAVPTLAMTGIKGSFFKLYFAAAGACLLFIIAQTALIEIALRGVTEYRQMAVALRNFSALTASALMGFLAVNRRDK